MKDIYIGVLVRGQWHGHEYTITRVLGHGGLNTVFLARREVDGRFVAIKFNARSNSLIYEYNILKDMDGVSAAPKVFDLDEWKGYIFLVIEYIKGYPLNRCIRRYGLKDSEIIYLLLLLAALLKMVWQKDYCLTDIKPENIILDKYNKRIVLVDWGSAIRSGQAVREFTPSYDAASWGIGQRIGDEKYMVFAACMTAAVLMGGSVPSPDTTTLDDFIKHLLKRKCKNSLKKAIIDGLTGKYRSLSMLMDRLCLIKPVPDCNSSTDRVIDVVLVFSAFLFIFALAVWLKVI